MTLFAVRGIGTIRYTPEGASFQCCAELAMRGAARRRYMDAALEWRQGNSLRTPIGGTMSASKARCKRILSCSTMLSPLCAQQRIHTTGSWGFGCGDSFSCTILLVPDVPHNGSYRARRLIKGTQSSNVLSTFYSEL